MTEHANKLILKVSLLIKTLLKVSANEKII